MSATLRIVGFILVLVTVFALALGIGREVGPVGGSSGGGGSPHGLAADPDGVRTITVLRRTS